MREDWIEIDYEKVVNKISTNNKKLKQKEYLQKGVFPVIDQGQDLVGGYTDDESKLLYCELPVIVFGDHTKIVKLINFKFAPGADGTKVLEPKKFVLPKYLSYLTQILVFKIKDKGYARHYQHIEKQTFPLAPLPEQRAIVAKIEQLFSELNNGIANLKAAKDKLEIYRAAVLQYAFENSFSEEIELEEVVEDHMIGIVRALKDQNTDGYGTPYIKMNNVNLNGQVDLEDVVWVEVDSKELEKYSLKNNDILINTRNSFELVGKTGIVSGLKTDYVFNNNLLRLRIKEDYLPKFIAYQLISPMVRNQMRQGKKATTNVCALYQRNIFPLKIRITDFDTQNQIVQEIESRLSVCDNILANIEEGLEKSEALRQSILKQAFEGKLLSEEELEACRKEPDWEPAEQLLERIKNEKKATT